MKYLPTTTQTATKSAPRRGIDTSLNVQGKSYAARVLRRQARIETTPRRPRLEPSDGPRTQYSTQRHEREELQTEPVPRVGRGRYPTLGRFRAPRSR